MALDLLIGNSLSFSSTTLADSKHTTEVGNAFLTTFLTGQLLKKTKNALILNFKKFNFFPLEFTPATLETKSKVLETIKDTICSPKANHYDICE